MGEEGESGGEEGGDAVVGGLGGGVGEAGFFELGEDLGLGEELDVVGFDGAAVSVGGGELAEDFDVTCEAVGGAVVDISPEEGPSVAGL